MLKKISFRDRKTWIWHSSLHSLFPSIKWISKSGFWDFFWNTSSVLSDNFSAMGQSVLSSEDLRKQFIKLYSWQSLGQFSSSSQEVQVILIYDRSTQQLDGRNYTLGTSTSQQLKFIKKNIKSTYKLLNKCPEMAFQNISQFTRNKPANTYTHTQGKRQGERMTGF